MNGRSALPSRMCGDSLIEVLVAILVLSFGLLALISLLANSLKLSSTSNYRTVAAAQATAMADAVRANPSMLTSFGGAAGPSATFTSACMTTAGCTTAQFVGMEAALWQERLAAMLPSGTGVICQDSIAASRASNVSTCDGNGPLVVKICWNEASRIQASGRSASGAQLSGSTQTCTWTNI